MDEARRMIRRNLPEKRMKGVVGRIKTAVIDERENEDEEPNELLKRLTALPKEGMTEAVVEAAKKVRIVAKTGVEVETIAKTGVEVETVAKRGVQEKVGKMAVMDEVAVDKVEDETWLVDHRVI